jgi:hypothetical protein
MTVRDWNPTAAIPIPGMLRVAALLICLLAASDAWGSCGDYLEHGPQSRITSLVVIELGAQSLRPEREIPCRGPHCRSGRETPSAPPAPPQWEQSREQAVAAEAGRRSEDRPTCRTVSEPAQAFAGYPRLIERPPRTA